MTTAFAKWRNELGLSREDAAAALGVSVATVEIYDAGHRRGAQKDKPVSPPFATRVLMWLIAKGKRVQAWPE